MFGLYLILYFYRAKNMNRVASQQLL